MCFVAYAYVVCSNNYLIKYNFFHQCHSSTAPSYPGTLPGDRRPENICVPDGDGHICDRRNCTTESFRPKTRCDDGTVYVSATDATPGESVREYVTALHELVANCNFG